MFAFHINQTTLVSLLHTHVSSKFTIAAVTTHILLVLYCRDDARTENERLLLSHLLAFYFFPTLVSPRKQGERLLSSSKRESAVKSLINSTFRATHLSSLAAVVFKLTNRRALL